MLYHKKAYKILLKQIIDTGYNFSFFYKDRKKYEENCCILRHDVDTNLQYAYEMALIEYEMNVKSTYFLMFRSPVYNLLSRKNSELVKKILHLGHKIGLHYDAGFEPTLNISLIRERIIFESKLLENIFDTKIAVCSFHQPQKFVWDIYFDTLVNTYNSDDLKDIHYFSDSNKKTFNSRKIINSSNYKKLHLLFHPMWWMHTKDYSTEEIWNKTLISNFNNNQEQLLETERAFGSKRNIEINTILQ